MSFYRRLRTFMLFMKEAFLVSLVLFLLQPVAVASMPAIQPLFEEALAASEQGEPTVALTLWDQVLEIAPNDVAALRNRGNVQLALGDPEGAIVDQTRALELSPADLDLHFNRAIAEEELQHWAAAADDYTWILESDAGDASAIYNLGNVRGSQGDWNAAAVLYGKAAKVRPGFVMARSSEALATYQLGDLKTAEAELRQLIRRYPMFADARAALSGLLWQQGFDGEAQSHWAAAAGLDNRYRQRDWLQRVRRWPPQPTADLMTFLALESQ